MISLFALWILIKEGFSSAQWIAFVLLFAGTTLGVTVGYHRMLTHRGFRSGRTVRLALSILGGMAAQGSEAVWVANHRVHHFYADQDLDPHSPLRYKGIKGLLWAHVGWLFYKYERPPQYRRFRDLDLDPIVGWQKRNYLLIVLMGFFLPGILLGWKGLLLAGFLRLAVSWNIAWSVNSVCHWIGTRAKDADGKIYTDDDSRNNLLVAVLSFGEGYHANHHVRPAWAFHGWHWYSLDASKWFIQAMERMGLVWNVKKPMADVQFKEAALVSLAS